MSGSYPSVVHFRSYNGVIMLRELKNMLFVFRTCYTRVRKLILVIADYYYLCFYYIKLLLLGKYLSHLTLSLLVCHES